MTFAPKVSGLSSATLTITNSDPVTPVLSDLLGGIGTALALNPLTLTFPDQTVGTSSTSRTVTLTNAGAVTLTINSITMAGTDFSLNNNCGGTLRAGRSCSVSLRFRPTAIGPRTASLVVNTSDVGAPQASVLLSGTGLAAALSTSPAALTFASTLNTQSVSQQVLVSNNGNAPLTLTRITLGGTNNGQFAQTTNCTVGTPMVIGASCTIDVTFRPTSTTPLTKSQTLNISVAAPATSQSIPLTGTVIVPTYSVSATALDFGGQAIGTISPSQAATVTNTGTIPMTLTNVAIGGANRNQFAQTNTCGASPFRPFPATLAVGASCTINVAFLPTTATASTASLSVSVGGGATPAQTQVPLTGTGQ